MNNKLSKYVRLNSSDRALLFNAFILLNLIRFGLFLLPFSKLLKSLTMYNTVCNKYLDKKTIEQADVQLIVDAVHTSNYYVLGNSKCLAKALTTQTLMSNYGYASDLKIGVAKENNSDFQAHAWVEYRGKVIIGNVHNLSSFVPITSI